MKQRGLYGADVVIGPYCVGLSSAYFVGALHEAPETQQILPPQHGRFVNRPYDLSGGTYPTTQNRPCAFPAQGRCLFLVFGFFLQQHLEDAVVEFFRFRPELFR